MDIKTYIAQASASHMERVAAAVEELRKAVTSAGEAGFKVEFKRVDDAKTDEAGHPLYDLPNQTTNSAILNPKYVPVLKYSVSIMERTEG